MAIPTKNNLRYLRAIYKLSLNGVPPTLRELASELNCWTSTTIGRTLKKLQDKGLVRVDPHTARGVVLTDKVQKLFAAERRGEFLQLEKSGDWLQQIWWGAPPPAAPPSSQAALQVSSRAS